MEAYEKIKKTLAVAFMHDLDNNRPEGKMCLSNGECADIEKAFNEQDWPKLARYLDKYTESEDEKILRTLVEYFGPEAQLDFVRGVPIQKIRNWLEKQKEQKPDIEHIQQSWYMEGYKDRAYNFEPKWIVKIGKNGPKYELNPKYGQPLTKEQKLTWSEEDEKMVRFYVADYNNQIGDMSIKDVIDMRLRFKYWLVNRLKSIRSQPKVEWREDDENNLNKLLQWDGIPLGLRSWLSGLPEKLGTRPSWKPSEEDNKILHALEINDVVEKGEKTPSALQEDSS